MNKTSTATRKANTYAGMCAGCGAHVSALAGHLGGKVNSRWTVTCCACSKKPATRATTRTSVRIAPRTYGRRPNTSATRTPLVCTSCGNPGYSCDCDNLY